MESLRSNITPMVTDYQGQSVDLMKFWEPTEIEQEREFGLLTRAVIRSISWVANKYHIPSFKIASYIERIDCLLQGMQLFQPFFVVGVKLSLDKWKISHHKWATWLYAGAWAAFNVGLLFFRHCIQVTQGCIEKHSLEYGIGRRQKVWATTVEAHFSAIAQGINDLLVRYRYKNPDVLIPKEDKLHECWNENMFEGWMMKDGYSFTNLDSVGPVAVSTDVCKTPYLTLRVRFKDGRDPFFVTLYPVIPGVNDQNHSGLSSTKEAYKLIVSNEAVRHSVMQLRENTGAFDEEEERTSSLEIVEGILSGSHSCLELDIRTKVVRRLEEIEGESF